MRLLILPVVFALLVVTPIVSAQDHVVETPTGEQLTTRAARPLQLRVLAGVSLPRAGGPASLGGGGEFEVDDDLKLDDMQASPNIEVSLTRHEKWTLTFAGFDYSTDARGTYGGRPGSFGLATLRPGSSFAAGLDMKSFGVDLAFHMWKPYNDAADNLTPDGDAITELIFSPLVGVRWMDVDMSVTGSNGLTSNAHGEWVGVYGGIMGDFRYRPGGAIPLMHMLQIEAGFAAGAALGGDDGTMWQVRAGVTWHFTPNVGAMLGYRLLEIDADDDDFSFNAGLQGLFVAGSIRF